MIRLASVNDAAQLHRLNEQFNGKGETTLENIKRTLNENPHEIVAVASENDEIIGFICAQVKKSFCYDALMIEITELFVLKKYRRKRVASGLVKFIETYCKQNQSFHRIELLTGVKNLGAQAFYKSAGYLDDGELHLSKPFEDLT